MSRIKATVPDEQWDAMTPDEQAAHKQRVHDARKLARQARGDRPYDPIESAIHRQAVRHAQMRGDRI